MILSEKHLIGHHKTTENCELSTKRIKAISDNNGYNSRVLFEQITSNTSGYNTNLTKLVVGLDVLANKHCMRHSSVP